MLLYERPMDALFDARLFVGALTLNLILDLESKQECLAVGRFGQYFPGGRG